ncbi:hypothetical protein DV738_g2026, partial [Chaetothyriales sp. CBS 135597]
MSDSSPLTSLEDSDGEAMTEQPPTGREFDVALAALLEEERSLQERRDQQVRQQRASKLAAAQDRVAQLHWAIEEHRPTVNPSTPDNRPQLNPTTEAIQIPVAIPATEGRKTIVNPDPYKGKTHREFLDFIYKCEINFKRDRRQFDTNEAQVLYALSLCKGVPMSRWREHEATLDREPTWKEFKTFLENLITHPEN